MTKPEATMAFLKADDAWGDELRRVFGREAGDMRYMSPARGEPGTRLRELYDAREAARAVWERAVWERA